MAHNTENQIGADRYGFDWLISLSPTRAKSNTAAPTK